MSKLIVLISGYAKSGKDVVADHLVKNAGFSVFKIADKLKNDVSDRYNIPIQDLESQKGKDKIYCINGELKTGRRLLIDTAAKERGVDTLVYTKDVIKRIKSSGKERVVISDIRYPIEITSIKSEFIKTRVIHARVYRFDKSSVNDPSETQLDDYHVDYRLNNKKDLNFFHNTISLFIKKFLVLIYK